MGKGINNVLMPKNPGNKLWCWHHCCKTGRVSLGCSPKGLCFWQKDQSPGSCNIIRCRNLDLNPNQVRPFQSYISAWCGAPGSYFHVMGPSGISAPARAELLKQVVPTDIFPMQMVILTLAPIYMRAESCYVRSPYTRVTRLPNSVLCKSDVSMLNYVKG